MEEERARQAALAAQNAQAQAGGEGGNGAAAGQAAQPDAAGQRQQPGAGSEQMDVDMQHMTEEEQLEWALRMSMQNDGQSNCFF